MAKWLTALAMTSVCAAIATLFLSSSLRPETFGIVAVIAFVIFWLIALRVSQRAGLWRSRPNGSEARHPPFNYLWIGAVGLALFAVPLFGTSFAIDHFGRHAWVLYLGLVFVGCGALLVIVYLGFRWFDIMVRRRP